VKAEAACRQDRCDTESRVDGRAGMGLLARRDERRHCGAICTSPRARPMPVRALEASVERLDRLTPAETLGRAVGTMRGSSGWPDSVYAGFRVSGRNRRSGGRFARASRPVAATLFPLEARHV